MENNYLKLRKHIVLNSPHLTGIVVGQLFFSTYFGIITATNINEYSKNLYNIYGFDIKKGLPRCNLYPRELTLYGMEPTLQDVLRLLKKVDLELDTNILWINKTILWDNRYTLKEQAESTIDKLYNLLTNGE